jgi:RNA polymerase sigma-70 factor (ECF subfamily)
MAQPHEELARLLTEARDGSHRALGEALQACRAYLLTVAGQELDPTLSAKAGASDLVQQTFLEAQRDFQQFDGTTETELLNWLRCVLRNNVANFARSYRETGKREVGREVALEAGRSSADWRSALACDANSPSELVMQAEQLEALEEAIARLPEHYRDVIEYRYRRELSFDEIGRLLGCSANAACKLWSRVVERLEKELGDRA